MRTKLLLIIAILVIPSCGVVDSFTVRGNFAEYEIKFNDPDEYCK